MVGAISTCARSSRHPDGGFTLIESLFASTILLVASVSIIAALIATADWYASAKLRAQASGVAAQTMAFIQARNYSDLSIASTGTWPASIPASMTTDTAYGSFSIDTSITPAVDAATQLAMTRIEVMVSSLGRAMTPVSLVSYVSNTAASGGTPTFHVPVRVVCVPGTVINNPTVYDANPDSSYNHQGTPVQLRDIDNLSQVAYTAMTDSNNVATFPAVAVGQYWLTSDPTYPVVHAIYFPVRISPAAGGTSTNPILSVNEYNLAVTKPNSTQAFQATLRVGAYRTGGWYFDDPIDGVLQFSTTTPYQPAAGLVVHAQPQLNTMDPGYYGHGSLSRYPDNTNMIYSGTVNGYGVACINIPWTLDPLEGQYWKVWATTTARPAGNPYSLFTSIPGGWTSVVNEPEKPASGQTTDIPQFQFVTGDPVNTP